MSPDLHPLLAGAGAVIFDFDGVLVDSEPMHEAAIREVAAGCGWVMTREHFARMVGKGDEHAFELLARECGGGPVEAGRIAEMCRRKSEVCARLIAEKRFTVQAGAAEVVAAAAARGPVAVCSGSRRAVVAGMLEASGLGAVLKTVVTHEDVSRPKPDPEGYLLAASRLGVEPGRCVVIEDSPTGLAAAKGAGMRTIAVEHSFPAAALAGAEVMVARISDLLR